jgi:hypothetical protein
MPPAEFEPAIPAGERLQTLALDRSATGITLTLQFFIYAYYICTYIYLYICMYIYVSSFGVV